MKERYFKVVHNSSLTAISIAYPSIHPKIVITVKIIKESRMLRKRINSFPMPSADGIAAS